MSRVDEAMRRRGDGPGGMPGPAADLAVVPFPPSADFWPSEDGAPAAAESAAALVADIEARAEPDEDDNCSEGPPDVDAASTIPEDVREKVVTTATGIAGSVEQYRRLAARLHLAKAERGITSVMVASALPGEGKTLTATNLALTLSDSYKREALLVDADLRRPSLHDMFGIANVAGLNDGLADDVERRVPLLRVRERLTLLTAGRPEPDPMSVLSSERMRRVLEDASRQFDWVIVDTPPVGLLTDAKLLAAFVDVVVFVIRAGDTPAAAIQHAVQAIGRDRIFGIVLNRVERPATMPDRYPYYGYVRT